MSYTPNDAPQGFSPEPKPSPELPSPTPNPSADTNEASEPKFESTIPWETALELVKLVRSGEVKENRIRAIQLGAWVVGCTATVIGERAGDEDEVVLANTTVHKASQKAQEHSLDTLADLVEAKVSGVNASGLFDPELIALILQIIKMISELRG